MKKQSFVSAGLMALACAAVAQPQTQEVLPPALAASAVEAAPAAPAVAVAEAAPAPAPAPLAAYSGIVPIQLDRSTEPGTKYPDDVLRLVNKSDRSKDAALLVVGALLGSFRTPVGKDDYKGEKIDAMPHPAGRDLPTALGASIDTWTRDNVSGRQFKKAMFIRNDVYALVFRDYKDETPFYDLKIVTTISRKPDGAGWLSAGEQVQCSFSDDKSSNTLADWQADGYARLKAAERQFLDDCVKTAQAALPKLLAP